MLRLLGLVLGTSVALAAPGTILPRRAFKWNCPPSECSNYLLQGTDTCYNYCVDGVCDVIAVDCQADCAGFCQNNCDGIAEDINKQPQCKRGLPPTPIRQPDPNPGSINLPQGTYNQPNIIPPYNPVTNPFGSLPGSEQETDGESVALVPLPDDNTTTDLTGTTDLGITLPSIDDPSQIAQLTQGIADGTGFTGFNDNTEITAFSPGVTDENLLAFANSDPLGSDTFSLTNSQEVGDVALGGSLDDFSLRRPFR